MKEHGQVQEALEALGREAARADLDGHGHLGRQGAQVAPLAVAESVEREVVGDLDAADAGRRGAPHEVRGGQGLRRLLSRNADRPRVGVAAEAQPHRTLLLALSSRTARKMTQAMTRG